MNGRLFFGCCSMSDSIISIESCGLDLAVNFFTPLGSLAVVDCTNGFFCSPLDWRGSITNAFVAMGGFTMTDLITLRGPSVDVVFSDG